MNNDTKCCEGPRPPQQLGRQLWNVRVFYTDPATGVTTVVVSVNDVLASSKNKACLKVLLEHSKALEGKDVEGIDPQAEAFRGVSL